VVLSVQVKSVRSRLPGCVKVAVVATQLLGTTDEWKGTEPRVNEIGGGGEKRNGVKGEVGVC
jgi:hypothetical protein